MIKFNLDSPLLQLTAALDALAPWVGGVAFLLTLFGYYSQVWQQRHDPPRMLEALGCISLAVALAFSTSLWWPLLVNLLYYPAEFLAGRGTLFQINWSVNHFFGAMTNLVTDVGSGSNGHGQLSPVWNFTWNFTRITRAGVTDLVIHALVSTATFLAGIVVLPFYFLQHFLVVVLSKLLPVAVCSLTVPALRGRAAQYFALTLSILAWPLGFTVVALVTNAIVLSNFVPSGASVAAAALAKTVQTLVAALVMILGTLLVPPTLLYLFRPTPSAASGGTPPP